MSFSDNYQLDASTIQAANPGGIPDAVSSPGFGSTVQLPSVAGGFPSFTSSPVGSSGTPSAGYFPDFSQTFADAFGIAPQPAGPGAPGSSSNPINIQRSTIPGTTPGPGTPGAGLPGTGSGSAASSSDCPGGWSLLGICFTRVFVVIIGIVFVIAGLMMFSGRRLETVVVEAMKSPAKAVA